MPRGADYAGGIQSDNPIEAGENKIAGAPKDGSDNVPTSAGVDKSHKAAPLPEGISEMKDQPLSGAGSQGLTGGDNPGTTGGGSGKGGKDEPTVDRVAEDLQGGSDN